MSSAHPMPAPKNRMPVSKACMFSCCSVWVACRDNCDGGLFSLIPNSSGWNFRCAGSNCAGSMVGIMGARLPSIAWMGKSGIGSIPTCLLSRSLILCVFASARTCSRNSWYCARACFGCRTPAQGGLCCGSAGTVSHFLRQSGWPIAAWIYSGWKLFPQ